MRLWMFFLLLCAGGASLAQQALAPRSFNENIHSIQVYPEGNKLGYPLIALGSGERLEFHFDMFADEIESLRFGVLHCDHDWKPSSLDYPQYVRGFQSDQISDIEYSFNTLFDFIHYQFSYPTDMSQLTLSGNYAMIVYSGMDINDEATRLVVYRFVVYEQQATVRANVHASSIIAQRYTHQEVDFDLAHKGTSINDPMHDIHALILQNFNWKRSSNYLKPIFIQPDVLTFDYFGGENTFEGCAEWRFFEMKDLRYQSNQVEHIAQLDDGYHVYLRPCVPEGKRAYSSWQDINGNFLVKNDQGGDDDLEADYVWAHVVLQMPEISDAAVLIEGAFNAYEKPFPCTYDPGLRAYTAKLLLKQGYYNYRFLLRDKYVSNDNIAVIEGSHAATENDYHIIIYMYDRTIGADRIIAVAAQ